MTVPSDVPAEPHARSLPLLFRRDRRITSGLDFERIYALRQKAGDPRLIIFASSNAAGKTRIGLSVSRRQGNSVQRHRIRRLLREAFRLEQHHLPAGFDFILIPGQGARTSTVEDFRDSLRRLTVRLAARLNSPPPS